MNNTEHNSAERIAGRAYGVMLFAGFGSFWLLLGLAALDRLNWATGVLAAAVLLALVLPALCLQRRAQAQPAAKRDESDAARVKRTFNRVNGAQYVAIPFVILGMNLLHRPEWISPGIAIVVGLHLFPLARLFHSPANYVTGAALIAWATGCMALLSRAETPGWSALGTAAILFSSAAVSLLRSRAALLPPTETQPA